MKIVNKALTNLAPVNASEEFEKLKLTLKQLGVEGVDDAKDIDTLRNSVKRLESDALIQLDNQIEEDVESLEKLGKGAHDVKGELDLATDSLEKQKDAVAD
jgi:L-lactate utilization protein LutB